MEEELNKQLPLLENTFIERLLKGEFSNPQEIDAFLSLTGLELKEGNYMVLLVGVFGNEGLMNREILHELGILKIMIKNCLKSNASSNIYYHDVDENKLAVLIALQEQTLPDQKTFIEGLSKKCSKELSKNSNARLLFSVGNTYGSLMDVSHSYLEAKHALEYKPLKDEESIIWYSGLKADNGCYYYPIELELRLVEAIKCGSLDQVRNILRKLHAENFEARKLADAMKKQLLNDLRGTIIKMTYRDNFEIGAKNLSRLEEDSSDFIDAFDSISKLFIDACDRVSSEKTRNESSTADEIIEYIHNNYSDNLLCIDSVASRFGLTVPYLYQLFKALRKATFSDYLENLRIKKACELLAGSDLTVDEIAAKVGYGNSRSFRRAFKRKEGVIPTAYRT